MGPDLNLYHMNISAKISTSNALGKAADAAGVECNTVLYTEICVQEQTFDLCVHVLPKIST